MGHGPPRTTVGQQAEPNPAAQLHAPLTPVLCDRLARPTRQGEVTPNLPPDSDADNVAALFFVHT